jgi:uncharacterized protein (UPF0335 family)
MPDVGGIAGAQLKSFIERIGRLEEEKQALGEDIKEVYAEAKGTGFEPKIMRQIRKIRKMDKDEHDEQESLLDRSLQMMVGTIGNGSMKSPHDWQPPATEIIRSESNRRNL